jgi:hypothetical protein
MHLTGPAPMDLQRWPDAVAMVFISALTASLLTNIGRAVWFVGLPSGLPARPRCRTFPLGAVELVEVIPESSLIPCLMQINSAPSL